MTLTINPAERSLIVRTCLQKSYIHYDTVNIFHLKYMIKMSNLDAIAFGLCDEESIQDFQKTQDLSMVQCEKPVENKI